MSLLLRRNTNQRIPNPRLYLRRHPSRPQKTPNPSPTWQPCRQLWSTWGLCPGQFLSKWFNSTTGYYNYPPLVDSNSILRVHLLTGRLRFVWDSWWIDSGASMGILWVRRGRRICRGHYPQVILIRRLRILGKFLIDLWERDMLMTWNRYPYNYHVCRVLIPFTALSGPIAAWFGQPGQGVQYQLSTDILGLIAGGFIERVDLTNL